MAAHEGVQGDSKVKKLAAAARAAAQRLQATTAAERLSALEGYKQGLLRFREDIEKANEADLQEAAASVASGALAEPLYQRLDCRGAKFSSLLDGLEQLIAKVPDPLGRCDIAMELCKNLHLYRVSCPIGVLTVIYEARPEAAVQIAALAMKSGNALILKGGKEASRTNKAIFQALRWGLSNGRQSDLTQGNTIEMLSTTATSPRSGTSERQQNIQRESHSDTSNAEVRDVFAREVFEQKRTPVSPANAVEQEKERNCWESAAEAPGGKEKNTEGEHTFVQPACAAAGASEKIRNKNEKKPLLPLVPVDSLQMIEGREEVAELLTLDEYVDLVIPRGSKNLVQYVKSHTNIPVLGHAEGLCSLYVDAAADLEKAVHVIVDSKLQYPAACNAIETLLVHQNIAGKLLPKLAEAAAATGLKFKADERALPLLLGDLGGEEGEGKESVVEKKLETRGSTVKDANAAVRETAATGGRKISGGQTLEAGRVSLANEADFDAEWLAPILAVKTVNSLNEAIEHINAHGSHHTDCIVTEDPDVAEAFLRSVDSAGVYHNCSTRFADGYRYGFGAEVGISTNRVHARGPVGVEGLLSYKYRLYGTGHTVGDLIKGRTKYTHKNLKNSRDSHSCAQEMKSIEDIAKRQRHL